MRKNPRRLNWLITGWRPGPLIPHRGRGADAHTSVGQSMQFLYGLSKLSPHGISDNGLLGVDIGIGFGKSQNDLPDDFALRDGQL